MAKEQNKKPSVFDFLDYREFLRSHYCYSKGTRAGFSFRHFSQKAGLGSSNFYKLVMDGDRGLSEKGAQKFSKALKLNKQETDFFMNLVRFDQAKDHDEKNRVYQKLLRNKKYQQVQPLAKESYNYYSRWYHPVVRELITSSLFDGDYFSLGKIIEPSLSEAEVKDSVELLLDLGLIKQIDEERFITTDSLVTTGPEAQSLVLMSYHKELLSLVRNQIEKVPSSKRDISALTLGVKKEKLLELKTRVQKFRKEIMELVSDQNDPDVVVLLSLQLMPLAERKKT